MNKYELAVVVSAKLEDEARAEVIEKVKAMITRFGGNVTDVDEWGKRRFAYEIQKMKEGFYYFIHFEAESTVPAEVEQRIRIMDNVLRYLCGLPAHARKLASISLYILHLFCVKEKRANRPTFNLTIPVKMSTDKFAVIGNFFA